MRLMTILFVLTLLSCKPSPVDIKYYEDECGFCKMKISDPNFGAELVTAKGKVYKFDSAECMFREYLESNQNDYAFVLVTDYTNPHTLVNAFEATYLVSENLPSPMGGNLSAYQYLNKAKILQKEKGGQVYNFDQIMKEYKAR